MVLYFSNKPRASNTMDHMQIEENQGTIIDSLPAEIWHQIVANFSIFDLPSLILSNKYFSNLITTKTKRDLIAKLRWVDDFQIKYKEMKRKFSEHFLKLALQFNDASFMDQFLEEEVWPWKVVCLQFIPDGAIKYYHYAASKTKEESNFRLKFFEEILERNATNILAWIMTQFDDLEPEELGFSLKKNGSFQLFLIHFLKSLHATEKIIRKLSIYEHALRIVEKYSDVLIRLLILSKENIHIAPDLSNIKKNRTESYVHFSYNVEQLLNNESLKYFQFLIFIHVTHDQFNLKFDSVVADKYEGKQCIGLFRLIKNDLDLAFMLTPLEMAHFTGDRMFVSELKQVVSAAKTDAHLGWVIASGADTENAYASHILKEVDINAQFSPALKTLFQDIFHKPIETALGMASLRHNSTARDSTIEWLLCNGAKFSENEIEFIAKQDGVLDVKKILFASETKCYSLLKNSPQIELDMAFFSGKIFRKAKKSNRERSDLHLKPNAVFSFFKNGVEFTGMWRIEDNTIICKSNNFIKRIFFGGSYGGFYDKVTEDSTEFKYNVLTTFKEGVVLVEANAKIKTPTFNNLMKLYWCAN